MYSKPMKLITCLYFILLASDALGEKINFKFEGSGSGTIGNTAFFDADFVVSINADTSDWVLSNRQEFWIDNLTGRITIHGIGVVTFLNPLFVYGFYGCDSVSNPRVCEFGEIPIGGGDGLGFGDGFGGNIIDVYEQDLTGYDLRTSFGPVAAENNILQQFVERSTSFGPLTYDTMSIVTFVSTLLHEIDIKPDDSSNIINPNSGQNVPVAILTNNAFDAAQVDVSTVKFGPSSAGEAHGRAHIEDIDNDGDMDLLLHFNTPETGIQCGDTEASLTGETFDGQVVIGFDAIRTVNCP